MTRTPFYFTQRVWKVIVNTHWLPLMSRQQSNIQLQTPTEFHAEFGKGIRGVINHQRVALGNAKLMESLNIALDNINDRAEILRKQGETVMFMVIEDQVVGIMSVADPIKPTTADALKKLVMEKMMIMMVT